MAIQNGASVESIERLVSLHERMERNNAEKQFHAAIAKFQASCPVIGKDATADTGKYKYTYATLGHIAEVIRDPLRQCGLSYHFDSTTTDGVVTVVCTVSHVAGHSRPATYQAPIDKGARMNVMQQGASALQYARRFALQLALGLSTADMDDDAMSACEEVPQDRGNTVTADDVFKLREALGKKLDGEAAVDTWITETTKMSKELHYNEDNWQPQHLADCRNRYRKEFVK